MRRYLGLVVCLLLAVFLALDKTLVKANTKNPNTARIYIEGTAPKRNIYIESLDAPFVQSSWCQDCVNTKAVFAKDVGHVSAKLTVKQDDNVTISLMGEHFMLGDQKMPLFTNYANFTVNGKKIFSEFKNADIKNYYKHKLELKAGQTVEFSVDVKKSSLLASLMTTDFAFYKFIIYFVGLVLVWWMLKKFIDKYDMHQKPDAIFIVVFGILLIIPMLHISNVDNAEQENRVLAPRPSLFVDDDINQKFGKQFEAWFSDRFNGREIFINLYKSIKYKLSSRLIVDGLYVDKQNKWIMQIPNGMKEFSPEELEHMSKNVDKLKRFAYKHNMKLYILIPPHKHLLYGDAVLPFYNSNDDMESKRTKQAIDYITKHNNIDVIYPYEELVDFAKTEMAFFKTDHHWTDGAAFVAYQKLIQAVKKDFPYVKVLKDNDFDYFYSDKVRVVQSAGFHDGSEYKKANLNDLTFFDTKYKYFKHKEDAKLKTAKYNNNKANYFVRNISFSGANKYNLTLFGDSFIENLEPTIPYSFKNTLKIYTWVPSPDLMYKNLNIQRFETDILDNKTNVLVVAFSNIGRLMYIYKD